MTILFGMLVFSAFAGLLWRALFKDAPRRAARYLQEDSLREELRKAAAVLGLSEPPSRGSTLLPARHGTMHGLEAELRLGGRGWHRISVRVKVQGLPSHVQVKPRPTGRDMEDFYLPGGAVDSGDAGFDAHHALYGAVSQTGSVGAPLLQFVARSFDPAFKLSLSATELGLVPGSEIPSTGGFSMRWRCAADNLVALWRAAEKVVKDGIEQRIFTPLGE